MPDYRMRALRFERTGSLDGLSLAEVPRPVPLDTELLVKVAAAAVNPSDPKNVLGRMHETTVPRVPGRDFAGTVERGPAEWLGRSVFGTGGNLGFGRDGSHAEYVAVPIEAAVPVPRGVSFSRAAGIGLPYLTASEIRDAAALSPGETILVLGVRGAVGSAVAWLAHRAGARVIGVGRTAQAIGAGPALPVAAWIDLESTDLAAGCRALTGGRGADVVFDPVGGDLFEPCLAALARRGRQVTIASGGKPRVSFNLVDFYHNESRLVGVDSLKSSFARAGQVLRELIPAFESGELPVPDVETSPLESGPEIYRQLEAGTRRQKCVLVP
jgi:NADPH:quinone reductase-like Zn-dependent oxidoreductase